jgi:predicted nucleic acid-binding protein
MPFVVDASIAAAWFMPDEEDPTAEYAFDLLNRGRALAPAIWWFEVRNLLIINERRQRLSNVKSAAALVLLNKLPIDLDRDPDEETILSLARKHRLTLYDASYLDAALRSSLPFVTLDRKLAEAARAEKIKLLSFLA